MRENYLKGTIRYLICLLAVLALVTILQAEPVFGMSDSAFQKQTVGSVKTESVDYRTVGVRWKKVSGAKGYEVYASRTRSGEYDRVASVSGGNSRSVDVRKCDTGQKYYFKVRAWSKSGSRKIWTEYSGAKAGRARLDKPVVSLMTIGAYNVRVGYEKVAGAEGYVIYRATSKKGNYKKLKSVKKSVRIYDDKKVKKNRKYFYRVRAYRTVSGRKIYSQYSKVRGVKTPSKDGNARAYDIGSIQAGKSLSELNILFLGSSVTRGKYSDNQSFVDILMKKDGVSGGIRNRSKYKSAVNGTTLVYNGSKSYIYRLKNSFKVGSNVKPDYLVCQLSTNDSRVLNPIGKVAGPSRALSKYAYKKTVTGAIEYIAKYTRQKYGCPVIFYVVPKFKSSYFHDAHYAKMRSALLKVKGKWDGHIKDSSGRIRNEAGDQILILDLWGDPDYAPAFNYKARGQERGFYMVDSVHPTKAGYVYKYTPAFESFLRKLLDAKAEEGEEEQAAEQAPMPEEVLTDIDQTEEPLQPAGEETHQMDQKDGTDAQDQTDPMNQTEGTEGAENAENADAMDTSLESPEENGTGTAPNSGENGENDPQTSSQE